MATVSEIRNDLVRLGVADGDTILIRAGLSAVGHIEGGADGFIEALLSVVGDEGTVVSLAFTGGSFIRKAKIEEAFNIEKKSTAGALPNVMLKNKNAKRSRHPMCSYVAIGRYADRITADHDENSGAYEPVRKLIELDGKCLLVGCVGNSPGFTTTHLAEADLGLLKRIVFPKLYTTYYRTPDGKIKLFRRKDTGLCSQSFYKFYAHYVKNEILKVGYVGSAYSIMASAREAYSIDYNLLKKDAKFNICGSSECYICNAGRWDRIHVAPFFLFRYIANKLTAKRHNKF